MHLKHRLAYKTTATVRILSETSAIFSDEISPDTKNCLSIIEADNKEQLWSEIQTLATAYVSKFVPCINLITDDKLQIIQFNPHPILIKTLKHTESSSNASVDQPF